MWITKMRMTAAWLAALVAVAGAGFVAQQALQSSAADADSVVASNTAERLAYLQQLIKPGAKDSQWLQVPWMPSTNIWAAREKAAREGKPILLWYMAGEPLGPC